MIRKNGEYRIDIREKMMGGNGRFIVENILEPEQFYGKGRLFAKGTLAPGDSVGWHVHQADTEICYFLSGTGVVKEDGGVQTSVRAGDSNIVAPGHGHEIINTGEQDLVYIALILFTES